MPVQLEKRATLVHKRSLIKRRITNLEKKITSLLDKEEVADYDVVCAKQFLADIQNLDQQFQTIHEKASELTLSLENAELVEKDNEELDMHDDRVRENSSKLVYFINTSSNATSNPGPNVNKDIDIKKRKFIERKWKRLDQDVKSIIIKVETALQNKENLYKEDLKQNTRTCQTNLQGYPRPKSEKMTILRSREAHSRICQQLMVTLYHQA